MKGKEGREERRGRKRRKETKIKRRLTTSFLKISYYVILG